jgi:hypothetical protein
VNARHAAALTLPLLLLAAAPGRARADELGGAWGPESIFGAPRPYALESVRTRYTHYDQRGHGYQSQADGSPGSEQLTVDQAQVEIVARQGERLTHTLWVPLDIVSAASPNAIDQINGVDAISSASRYNEGGTVALATAYRATRATTYGVHGGFHIEEQYRSWDVGASIAHSFADDNALIAASVNQYVDWFDKFDIHGVRLARLGRSTTNLNLGLTQLLSATTVAHVDYGVTLQTGGLGNTWNAVPDERTGGYIDEVLPTFRQRHAFVARLAQWLPWRGALHGYYRFYVDDWGLLAHTLEHTAYQRLTSWLWLRATYRLYRQNGVSFFRTRGALLDPLRTADSDLAPFWAHTVGGAVGADVRVWRRLRSLHAEVGYDRYWRTNDLAAHIVTCGVGFVF